MTAPNRRMFVTDIKKILQHAIDHGLLDAKLKFESGEPIGVTATLAKLTKDNAPSSATAGFAKADDKGGQS